MSGASTTGDTVLWGAATVASDACFFAGCFPPSVVIGDMIPKGVGSPFAIGDACGSWKDAAATLQSIQQGLEQMCTSLPAEAWTGDDRQGFDTEIKNLLAELGDSHNTAEAIGITLEVLVPMFPVWITESAVVSGILAIAAATFYAAAATGVLDVVGVSEELYATGLEISATCLEVMNVSKTVLMGILAAATASLAIAVGVDIKTQTDHGDTAALGDLGQATVDGLGQDLMNAAQWGVGRKLDKRAGGGTEHEDPPGTSPSAVTGYLRGREQTANLGNRTNFQFADKAKELGVDMTHIPATLQDLINAGTGRSGPEVTDLEDVADEATEDESGSKASTSEGGEH